MMTFISAIPSLVSLTLLRSHASSAFSTTSSLLLHSHCTITAVTKHKLDTTENRPFLLKKEKGTALFSSNRRGLATQMEGATPTEGGMTLLLKAGPDGQSIGDCPFAQYIGMILNEKKLPYTTRPCTKDTKPSWLIDHYEGKMPALRHRSECYVESDVIAEYLEFFFKEPSLTPSTSEQKKEFQQTKDITGAVFPAIAKYLKYTEDGDEKDSELKSNLREVLSTLETQLSSAERKGPFLVGDGEMITTIDCSLAPKLFHMKVGIKNFKQTAPDSINLESEFPALTSYMNTMFSRDSFKETLYPEETVVWGWSNARA